MKHENKIFSAVISNVLLSERVQITIYG